MRKFILSMSVVFALVSCSKNTDSGATVTVTTKTVANLPADTIIGLSPIGQPVGRGRFTFYSLENNAIVAASDSATNKWDLGFRGTTIITNSGNSGPGAGGAFVFVGLFADLNTIPADSAFKVDNAPSAYAVTLGSNRGWYVYDAVNNLVNPIPGRVLVVRTATGKYAKVEILNYYRGGVTPAATASDAVKINEQRYYTFRFSYQANGSKSF